MHWYVAIYIKWRFFSLLKGGLLSLLEFNSVLFIKQKFRRKVTSRCFTLQSEDTKISERKHHQAAGFPSSWAAFSECGEEELPFSRKRGEGGWRDPVPGNQWSSENNARSSLMATKSIWSRCNVLKFNQILVGNYHLEKILHIFKVVHPILVFQSH